MDVIGYTRVSKVGGREGDSFISPKQQREAIEGLAKREGLTVVDWYEELDASGGDSSRPLWNRALDRIESKRDPVKGIAVWNLSRFSRSTIDALNALERLEAAGGALYSVANDVGDATPTGKLTRTIFAALAQMERERSGDNFAAARKNAIERGIFTGSTVPTGYTRDPETRKLEPNELAPLVRELFELRAAGKSWTEIVRHFIANGGSDKTRPQTVSNMLRNPSYLGVARSGDFVNEKAHPPIVTRRLFDSVQGKQVARKHVGKAASESLLGGVVVCDSCGYRMIATSSGRGQLVYRCKQVACSARAACYVADLDAEVLRRVFAFMASVTGEFQQYFVGGRPREDESDLAEAASALADAEYLLGKFEANKLEYLKAMTASEFADTLAELRAAVAEAKLARDFVTAEHEVPAASTFEDFRASWDEWTHESRKEWLSRFLDRVVVTSAGGKPQAVSERMALHVTGRGDPVVLDQTGGFTFVGHRPDVPDFPEEAWVALRAEQEGTTS